MRVTLLLLSILMLSSCKTTSNEYQVRGSGKIVSKEISIDNYSQIKLSGSGELIYEQKTSKKPYLRVEADDNLIDYVSVRQRGNALVIHSSGRSGSVNYSKLKIYTNSPGLSEIKILGANTVNLKGNINSTNLKLIVEGVSKLKADKLKCANLEINLSGSGDLVLGGEAYSNDIKLSGSGSIDAYDLKTRNTTCNLSGSGSAKIRASELLDARISGSGNLKYKGSPMKIRQKVSGSGWLKAE